MAPGVAPPRRAAAAWPNSWKPAESTVTTRISSTRPGLAKASCVAEASPLTISTHQHVARKAAVTATTIRGLNSVANGAVIFRVRSGSVTEYRKRMPSSGFDFFTAGSEPSASRSRPSGRSWEVIRVRTFSALTSRPKLSLACPAISSRPRLPSIASSTRYSRRVSWMVWPSERRTRDGASW